MSIATVNKISDLMNPFNGVNHRPRLNVTINGTSMSWLFDTGSAITCMPIHIFNMVFKDFKPTPIKLNANFKTANGGNMKTLGAFELNLIIRGQTYKQKVIVLDTLTDCIIGVDFMHLHNARYNPDTKRITFRNSIIDAIHTVKETLIPAFSSKVIKTAFPGLHIPDCSSIVSIHAPEFKTISGCQQVVSLKNGVCSIVVDNVSPIDITLPRQTMVGFLEQESAPLIPFNDSELNNIVSAIQQRASAVKQTMTKQDITNKAKLNVPFEHRQAYIDVLFKHQHAISSDKYDLGLASSYTHKIHLKDNNPVYRKQFKIPEAHQDFIEQTLDEWLRLGVVRRSNSLYNSPIFCVPKKQGQGLRIVQDFRELNNHTHTDKYSMKEIHECIGDIGRSGSTIFSTLDLTSGFWQMPLDDSAKHLTAFTIPGRGQFEWITSPMGLLGCPASFQRLMELVLRGIKNCIVYIDDLLLHSHSHTDHIKLLDDTLARLTQHNLKINIDKCIFGNTSVNYLGFVLTPDGVKPGSNKLQAISDAKPPTDVKMVRSFLGLCNFFRSHIKNFAIIAAPLFALTKKDSGFKNSTLPPEAMTAFNILKRQLTSQPTMAYPRSDRQYALITDASTGSATEAGGLGAILTQVDTKGCFHAIAYASRQLKTNEKNYSPFLLEAAAAVWGMEHFHEYLKGKRFILYTDHKPLEKLGHLHSKTMNRLQSAMLEYDFLIQYKKGSNMPADFLSRQFADAAVNEITEAFDPFQPDLKDLQKEDEDLQIISTYLNTGKWNQNVSKHRLNIYNKIVHKIFQDKNKLVWIRLDDYNYPRTALWLPGKYRKLALCEAHNNITGGHDAALKSYMKITNSYWWPNVYSHAKEHAKTCEQCQFRKTQKSANVPLRPLPIPDAPHQRIHADLFGPLMASDRRKKYVLCMTDAFTKFAVVTAVNNKEAETVARAIFEQWFCKFGIPVQIHTDGGKEFCNKLAHELFTLLNVQHTKTSPAHPQCNAQVEVFNKTVKKYLNSFVDNTTLNWEEFLPALSFAYNTSYHSTISTTPFELLFGVKARLPSFPNPDIQKIHYGENFAAERLNILQKARSLAHQHATLKGAEYKSDHDKRAKQHNFQPGQQVMLREMTFLHKNPKLARQWSGPHVVLQADDTNVSIKLNKSGKAKTVHVERIKSFVPPEDAISKEDLDFSPNENWQRGPLTRSKAKLIRIQEMLNLINNEFREDDDTDDDEGLNQLSINAIDEDLREKLMNIAYKLLISDEDNFKDLTPSEQQLWKSFPTSDIYEFLTGIPDEIPEFRYDWIRPSDSVTIKFTQPQLPPDLPQGLHRPPPPNQQQPQVATPGPSTPSNQSKISQFLRPRKDLNYKDLHTGKSVFKQAKLRASKRWTKAVTTTQSFFGSPSSSSK